MPPRSVRTLDSPTNADRLILEPNPAARLLSGCERSRLGTLTARFFTQGRRVALLVVLQAAECGAGWADHLWISPRLSLAFWASVTVTPVSTVGNAPPPHCAG